MRVMAAVMLMFVLALPTARAATPLQEVWRDQSKAGPVSLWTVKVRAYAPPTLAHPSAPAVVVMHGCLQGADETFEHSGWRKMADQRGILLLMVEFDDLTEHCAWWFQHEERRPDTARQGKAIVEGLAEARRRFQVPQGENYVTGLSAGGAMTVVLLALYPDTFAAGGAIAGVPFDCPALTDRRRLTWAGQPCIVPGLDELPQACACLAGDVEHSPQDWAAAVKALHPERTTWPRISVWQGTTDPVVACHNGVDIAAQWSALHGGPAPTISCADEHGSNRKGKLIAKRNPAGDRSWTLPGKNGRPAVELRLLDGFTHSLPIAKEQGCGSSGKGFAEAGVCAAADLTDFFLGKP
jgi:poly(3-hydroxybutyrate) depolymerase